MNKTCWYNVITVKQSSWIITYKLLHLHHVCQVLGSENHLKKRKQPQFLLNIYERVLRLSLAAHPSWTWTEYCKFQSTSSIEGRCLKCFDRQLMDSSVAVLKDSYANVPRIDGSVTPCRFCGASIKLLSSCQPYDFAMQLANNQVLLDDFMLLWPK